MLLVCGIVAEEIVIIIPMCVVKVFAHVNKATAEWMYAVLIGSDGRSDVWTCVEL